MSTDSAIKPNPKYEAGEAVVMMAEDGHGITWREEFTVFKSRISATNQVEYQLKRKDNETLQGGGNAWYAEAVVGFPPSR